MKPKVVACDATKQLHDVKGLAPLVTLRCDRDKGHNEKRHYDAAMKVEWFG